MRELRILDLNSLSKISEEEIKAQKKEELKKESTCGE